MFWKYTPVNTSKKVHSGLARWLTSAINNNNNNNIRTIAPICAVLTVCTAALSVTHVLTQWLLVPLGGKYFPVSRRRIFLRESRSSSTRWRLCSLCTSHPGRLESFYKECALASLVRGPENRKEVRKEGSGREGRKEGRKKEVGEEGRGEREGLRTVEPGSFCGTSQSGNCCSEEASITRFPNLTSDPLFPELVLSTLYWSCPWGL